MYQTFILLYPLFKSTVFSLKHMYLRPSVREEQKMLSNQVNLKSYFSLFECSLR